MASHYAVIGFNAPSEEALEAQVMAAVRSAYAVPCGPGFHLLRWEGPGGAALWVQTARDRIVGVNPFLADAPEYAVRVEAGEPDASNPMDGQVRVYLLPDETVILPVDVVNWPLAAPLIRPQAVLRMRLAAFAESLEWWASPRAYEAAHPESRRQGTRWIVPTGLYPPDKGGTGRSTAMVVGQVRDVRTAVNDITGAPFMRLRIETRGALLEVAAVPADPLPPVGGVVSGHFWLAGQVIGAALPNAGATMKDGE